ncbi:MAG: hypothetical protein V4662_27740 [Verrucomicrobiota bacterium]
MKNSLICTLLLSLTMTVLATAKDVGFPKAEPAVSLDKPEGWKSKFEEGRLYVTTDDDESVIIEVSALKTSKQKGAEALAEMKASVEETFKKVEFKPMQEGGSNNVGLYILNGSGEDEDGKAVLNAIMVTNGDNDDLYMIFIASTPEGSKEYGEEIGAILASIKKP